MITKEPAISELKERKAEAESRIKEIKEKEKNVREQIAKAEIDLAQIQKRIDEAKKREETALEKKKEAEKIKEKILEEIRTIKKKKEAKEAKEPAEVAEKLPKAKEVEGPKEAPITAKEPKVEKEPVEPEKVAKEPEKAVKGPERVTEKVPEERKVPEARVAAPKFEPPVIKTPVPAIGIPVEELVEERIEEKEEQQFMQARNEAVKAIKKIIDSGKGQQINIDSYVKQVLEKVPEPKRSSKAHKLNLLFQRLVFPEALKLIQTLIEKPLTDPSINEKDISNFVLNQFKGLLQYQITSINMLIGSQLKAKKFQYALQLANDKIEEIKKAQEVVETLKIQQKTGDELKTAQESVEAAKSSAEKLFQETLLITQESLKMQESELAESQASVTKIQKILSEEPQGKEAERLKTKSEQMALEAQNAKTAKTHVEEVVKKLIEIQNKIKEGNLEDLKKLSAQLDKDSKVAQLSIAQIIETKKIHAQAEASRIIKESEHRVKLEETPPAPLPKAKDAVSKPSAPLKKHIKKGKKKKKGKRVRKGKKKKRRKAP